MVHGKSLRRFHAYHVVPTIRNTYLVFVKTSQLFKVVSCTEIPSKTVKDSNMGLVISLKSFERLSQLCGSLLETDKCDTFK
jgi:hypothetical protein